MRLTAALSLCLVSGVLFLFTSCDRHCDASCNASSNQVCDKGSCNCAPGYTGSNCDTLEIFKFLGSYNVTDNCSNTGGLPNNSLYTVNILQDPSSIQVIDIENLGNNGFTVQGYVTNNTLLQIPDQSISGGEFTGGQGTFNVAYNTITITYQYNFGGVGFTCTNTVMQHQ